MDSNITEYPKAHQKRSQAEHTPGLKVVQEMKWYPSPSPLLVPELCYAIYYFWHLSLQFLFYPGKINICPQTRLLIPPDRHQLDRRHAVSAHKQTIRKIISTGVPQCSQQPHLLPPPWALPGLPCTVLPPWSTHHFITKNFKNAQIGHIFSTRLFSSPCQFLQLFTEIATEKEEIHKMFVIHLPIQTLFYSFRCIQLFFL